MLSVEEAKRIITDNLPSPASVMVALDAAEGLVLANDVFASEASPLFDNSAMDGYAVQRSALDNTTSSAPVRRQLIGESKAGEPFSGTVGPGQTVRINTGALVPDGADTVIRQEDAHREGDAVDFRSFPPAAANIRRRGEEYDKGTLLFRRGDAIDAAHLAVLAAQGMLFLPVYQRPRVALIVTGSELVPYWSAGPLPDGCIRDSNSVMLAAQVRAAGGSLSQITTVGDSPEQHAEVLAEAQTAADILLFSGGVSVGPHDLVRSTATADAWDEKFWRVNQKPGKPLFFAVKDRKLMFGLPGNPVSAYMCFHYYVAPAIRSLLGRSSTQKTVTAIAGEEFVNRQERVHFLRVRLEPQPQNRDKFYPLRRQGSHMLLSLTEADGFIMLREGQRVPAEQTHQVMLF